MIVYFHPDFYRQYTADPAAESGRMEAIVTAVEPVVRMETCVPAADADLLAAHTRGHLERIRRAGLADIAALAAGGAIMAATRALAEPSFALIRPPGHHASADSCWGFCFFNNVAVSLLHLKNSGLIDQALVLDFDLHFGDGTVNILGAETWVEISNPNTDDRESYVSGVRRTLAETEADMIAVSAGFDNHRNDWGGLLTTADFETMGALVAAAAERNGGGCYGVLEGGYNHRVLGRNVLAFLTGLGSL